MNELELTRADGLENATGTAVTPSLLRYYIHDSAAAFRLELIGELRRADVPELEGCWRTAQSSLRDRRLRVDLRRLRGADEGGRQWLAGMESRGAEYMVAGGAVSKLEEALAADSSEGFAAAGTQVWYCRLLQWLRFARPIRPEGAPAEASLPFARCRS